MDDQVNHLVAKAWERYQRTPPNARLLIAIGGIPGSGKTTLSQLVVQRLNALAQSSSPGSPAPAAFVPMDGYHLTRAQLSALPDPAEAHRRRGAAFTFDGEAFRRLVTAAREPLAPSTGTIRAPSFDHAIKDPKEDDIAIEPSHRILVFEGLYITLDKPPWNQAAALMDETWFVDVDFDVARKRLIRRHVQSGIVGNEADGDERARGNDLVNGQEILNNRLKVDEVVVSREDNTWVHK
ncbi:P-loop containing nucleoside triphosphate hydrolase protein [Plectosphaerella plurivora]|uniref:P-loop containing nucleoside triphosphate hydrolase protein n=1 Tax=Plectosphaerella plurivora TaxID=936078 RepID=A0A9P8VJW6_9PEZI|nr:P-loop containing nucleoside triphosphate hydrolase protein [Plectosphaerella plurivora]